MSDAKLFTLGIEEEFQLIDLETRDLRSHVQELLAAGGEVLKDELKPEMHQSVIEVGTSPFAAETVRPATNLCILCRARWTPGLNA